MELRKKDEMVQDGVEDSLSRIETCWERKLDRFAGSRVN